MKYLEGLFLSILFLFLLGCTTPDAYLDEAMDIMEENSINRHSINWEKLRNEVYEIGKDAKTFEETHPAIIYALYRLNDNHSTFMTAEEYKFYKRPNLVIPEVKTVLLNNDIGYIRVPGFRGNGEGPSQKFARQIQDKIKELDQFNIEYWIVDLSINEGGYVWPMMCGLGPIYGDGVMGYLVDVDDNYFSWGYKAGEVIHKEKTVIKLENPYVLRKKIKRLVVIIGERTASAGEALTISFKGVDNTIFIGNNTMGISTGNEGFTLKDGALINLTTSKFADRDKNIYGFSIEPDIEVSLTESIETAVKLLKER